MQLYENYELILNQITYGESMMDEKRYLDYTYKAALWLNQKGKYFFEDQIMNRYITNKLFEEILEQRKHEFIPGMIAQRNEKREQIYYDVWGMDVIKVEDPFFPFFFACKLSHIDLFNIDEFLKYHLENGFENSTDKYYRILQLILRQYSSLLKPDTIITSQEWINDQQKKPALTEIENLSTKNISIRKPKIKREAGDNITALNLSQTAYLAVLLKESKIAIKDDIILTQSSTGAAFHVLTGYSEDTLRQAMNLKGQNALNRQDRTKVRQTLSEIITLIDKDIKDQKTTN